MSNRISTTYSSQVDELIAGVDEASGQIVLVAAHPDDEVIGAGGQLSKFRECTIVHATNGAPNNPSYANAAGFSDSQHYAEARSEELRKALSLAGIQDRQLRMIGIRDQESVFHLMYLTRELVKVVQEFEAETVVTHPYEGGHPDHDACAFAVKSACELLRRAGRTEPRVIEFTSYHSRNGELCAGEFLHSNPNTVTTFELDEEARRLKRAMFDCFATQREVLAAFPIERERFRPAPSYDFTQPPHEGALFYERFDWGITPQSWRANAADARRELGLCA